MAEIKQQINTKQHNKRVKEKKYANLIPVGLDKHLK